MKGAIFFDRDGCLIKDKHYQHKVEDLEFFPGTFRALKLLQNEYDFFLVTNQSGIGRGYFDFQDLEEFHAELFKRLGSEGIQPFKEAFICPHTPEDQCHCRKPSPYFVLEALKKYGYRPNACYMIGDKSSDLQCGINAGIHGALLGKDAPPKSFSTLLDFAQHLKKINP